MMRFLVIAFCGISAALTASARAADPDPVKAKLDAVKSALEVERSKFNADVAASFDTREAAARKDGNKKLLDEIKLERKQFDDKGLLPRAIPAAIRQRMSAAIDKVDAAYGQAIKQYTIAKQDDQATAVEKEHNAFKRQIERFKSKLDLFQIDTVWKGDFTWVNGRTSGKAKLDLQVVERDGKSFTAALSYGDGTEAEGVGTIEKGKLQWKRTVAGTLRKADTVIDFTGVIKDEKMYVEFVTSGNGPSGKGIMVLEKKK